MTSDMMMATCASKDHGWELGVGESVCLTLTRARFGFRQDLGPAAGRLSFLVGGRVSNTEFNIEYPSRRVVLAYLRIAYLLFRYRYR